MITVTLIGTGNVAHHLYSAFSNSENVQLIQVFGRKKGVLGNKEQSAELSKSPIKKADVYMLAVSDDAISEVSQEFKDVRGLVVHTSGGMAMEILPKEIRQGVFYPLQTFSKKRMVPFDNIPLCIEAEQENDKLLLQKLAESISTTIHQVSSEKRAHLHLAAVFVNNFVNHFYKIGADICQNQNFEFDILKPLILETAHKIEELGTEEAQTGPAKRGDSRTIDSHLELLKKNALHKEIYTLLSQSISETYGKKL